MFGRLGPVADNLSKLVSGHTGMSGHCHLQQSMFAACQSRFQIPAQNRCKRFRRGPFGMLRCKRHDAIEDEKGLKVHGLL